MCGFCGASCEPTDFTIVDSSKNVDQAEDDCLRKGGHLASAHSDADADTIQALIAAAGLGTAWIGFHDRDAEVGCSDSRHQGIGGNIEALEFIWTDAVDNTTTLASGEPNDWQAGVAHCDGTGNEDCTEAWRGGRDWNDANCDGNKPFVCGFCEQQAGAAASAARAAPPPAGSSTTPVTTDLGSLTVETKGTYTDPVIMLGPATHNGDDEAVARITRASARPASTPTSTSPTTRRSAGVVGGRAAPTSRPRPSPGWSSRRTNGDLQAGATTGSLCSGGAMCNAQWGCNSAATTRPA